MMKFAQQKAGEETNIEIHLLAELSETERERFMTAGQTNHYVSRIHESQRQLVLQLHNSIFRSDKNFEKFLRQWSQPPFFWTQSTRKNTKYVVFQNLILIMSEDWGTIITGFPRDDWFKSLSPAQLSVYKTK